MKTLYIYIILMLLLPFFSESNIYAQKRSKQYSEIKAKVVDKEGNPIQSVRITVDEGIFESSTDKQGKFSLKVTDNSTLVFDVPGFEPQYLGVSVIKQNPVVVMEKSIPYGGVKDEVELPFRCVAMTSQPIPVRIFRLQAHELVIVLSRHAYVYVIVPRDEPLVTQYPYQRTANHIPPQSVSLANIHEEPENLHLRHLHFSNIVHRCLKLSFKKLSYPSNCLIFLAGLPTYTEFASKSFTTTDPAPTTVPLPMVTPGRIVTLAPIQQPSPITIGLNTVFLSALRFPLDI